MASPPALNADGNIGTAPSIARLNTWLHANVVAGGPIGDKAGLFTTTAATRSTHFERSSLAQIDANVASSFATLTVTPRAGHDIRTIGWLQRSRDPAAGHFALAQPNAGEEDISWHAQSTWERLVGASGSVRVFGGITSRRRTNELEQPEYVIVERLRDGPIPNLLDAGPGKDRTWTAGIRGHSAPSARWLGPHHAFAGGVDVSGALSTNNSSFAGRVGEMINGQPARMWAFTNPAAPSTGRSRTLAAYVGDTVALAPRLTVNAGLRFEAIDGFRESGSGSVVSWRDFFPRAGAHLSIMKFWDFGAFGQYNRYGHRLPLRHLMYGDPTAPTGSVYRWDGAVGATTFVPGTIGPLVQRVGPGTNGDAAFSAIDPALRRPHMDEMILGFEMRPHPRAFARLSAIGRRERRMIGLVDTGVPESVYTTIGIPDTNVDHQHTDDDQILLFYNRPVSAFGNDRYLLTNPSDDETSFVGADLTGQMQTDRLVFLMGITAGRSEALSANRGFGPLENDGAVLGEVYTNPNARDHAQGRVFTERGYTIKLAATYRFAHELDGGVTARYQDGQHFARLVIMEGLNQGPEAVRAFRNGRTRFTFSMTMDARLQKRFKVGRHTITAVLDGYNFLNQALEVEEFSVSGATSRLKAAVQPPRVFQVGLRIPF